MKQHYTETYKRQIVKRYLKGESVISLSKETSISRSTIYGWLQKYKPAKATEKIKTTDYNRLKRTVERQAQIIKILKTVNCNVHSDLIVRMNELEKLLGDYNKHVLCEALDVDRGSFYNHIKRNKRDDNSYKKRREYFSNLVRNLYYESNQVFGARKIAAILRNQGERVSDDYVLSIMQELGLCSIRTQSKKDYLKEKLKKNILRQEFSAERPNSIWVSDVTYFMYKNTWYHICVIIDLYSRKVISYSVSKSNSTHLTTSAIKKAINSRSVTDGLILHSDNGSNYISAGFEKCLAKNNITHSFSRPHNPHDNAVSEAFFASMKKEELYRRKYESVASFMKAIESYIQFYNEKRPHAALNYKTPVQFEAEYENTEQQP